ncbi:MAG: hemerythrin domain-containing protein [Ignavibacteriales bacterium]|nr:hemerythrin domain-containing protein [Ignavibacteriales bacterium]
MKPTDILKKEHRAIERMLRILDTVAEQAEAGEKIPSFIFRDAIRFLQQFADKCHHGKEEAILFPAMVQKGFSQNGGPIGVMLGEHDEGREHIRAMLSALERYEQNDRSAVRELANHSHAFTELLRMHIHKEDNILFMMAEQSLSETEQQKLLDEFFRVEQDEQTTMMKKELLDLLVRMEGEYVTPQLQK